MILFRVEYWENVSAIVMGRNLSGHQMSIPQRLNRRWEKATTIAARFPVTRAARMAVTVVPIFEPRVYGKI